jgi:hypothetical protein
VKRTITILLLIIIHAFSAFSLITKANSVHNISSVENHHHANNAEKQHSWYYNTSTFISSGAESVVVNFGFNLLKLPQRIHFGSEHAERIRNFKLLVQQKLTCTNKSTTMWLAFMSTEDMSICFSQVIGYVPFDDVAFTEPVRHTLHEAEYLKKLLA